MCVSVCLLLCVYIWLQEEKTEEKTSSPPSGAPVTGPAGVAKATAPGGVAKENGMKEPAPTPFGGDGLKETLSLDKRITETSGCKHTQTHTALGLTAVIVAGCLFSKPLTYC